MITTQVKFTQIPPALYWFYMKINTLPTGVFIAGGAIRSIFDKSNVEDIDIFFESFNVLEKMKQCLLGVGFICVFECPRRELYSFKHSNGLKVQLITIAEVTPEQAISSFDFTCSQFAMITLGDVLTIDKKAIKHASKKKLKIASVTYPYATFFRVLKYIKKGYRFSEKELHKFVIGSSDIEFNEINWRKYID